MSSRSAAGTREMQERQRQAAQRSRERRMQIVVAVALVLLLVGGGIGYQLFRTTRSPSVAPPAAGPAGLAPVPIVDGRPILLGSADAPVTLRLYEDFHCEHCIDFEERLGEALAREQDAGRVVVELYPMSFVDEGSAPAANAMACAAESGFGRAYYSGLFANAALAWSDQQLVELAGLATPSVPDSFRTCVTTKAHQGWLDSITASAAARGVTATPSVFVADAPVEPSVTAAELTALIDQAAARATR